MKAGLKFNHWGIPTKDRMPPMYFEGGKVHLNDFSTDDYAVEWLNFEEGSPMPELIQKMPHIAFEVENLAEALKGEKVLVEPFAGGENMTCAFIEGDGFAVELIEFKK